MQWELERGQGMARPYQALVLISAIALIAQGGVAVAQNADVQVLHQELAHYSRSARMLKIEGSSRVMVKVSPAGDIFSVRVVEASNRIFQNSAKLAGWLSTFKPAIKNGIAIEDSITLDYTFRLSSPNHSSLQPFPQNREQLVELLPNQICLYGNWLSDHAYVRLSEDRVYVGGIRVHPDIPNFSDSHAEWGFPELIEKALVSECRLQERELALRDLKLEAIRNETLDMLKGLRIIERATLLMSGEIRVETFRGETLEFELPDPFDKILYHFLQPQSYPAEESYYFWLSELHPGLGQHLVIHTFQIKKVMSLKNQTAIEIRRFLESAEKNQWGGLDWPEGLCGLLSDMEAVLVKPMVVKRL